MIISMELEGANERIETYRKGKAKLVFMLENSSSKAAKLDIGLVNHAFNFGVSMTQKDPLKGQNTKIFTGKEF